MTIFDIWCASLLIQDTHIVAYFINKHKSVLQRSSFFRNVAQKIHSCQILHKNCFWGFNLVCFLCNGHAY